MPARKMSEILLEFCRPLMPDNPTKAQVEAAATHATFIWHLGLKPAAERERFWAALVAGLPPEMPPPIAAEFTRILRGLLNRRITEFAADGRIVAECTCVTAGGKPRLRVAFADRGGRNEASRELYAVRVPLPDPDYSETERSAFAERVFNYVFGQSVAGTFASDATAA